MGLIPEKTTKRARILLIILLCTVAIAMFSYSIDLDDWLNSCPNNTFPYKHDGEIVCGQIPEVPTYTVNDSTIIQIFNGTIIQNNITMINAELNASIAKLFIKSINENDEVVKS